MSDKQAIDVGQLIDNGHWSTYQKWLLALTAIAFGVDGMANQVLAVAMPTLIEAWHTSRDAFSPVLAMGLFGLTLGSLAGGVIGDVVGRRWALITSMLVFGGATVATAFAPDVKVLMYLRLIDGLGIGAAIPNGAALISEYTPERRRSRGIAWGMVFIPVGSMLAGMLGSVTLAAQGQGWQNYFLLAGLFPLAAAVIFVFVLPESPRFLQSRPHRKAQLVALMHRFGHPLPTEATFAEASIKRAHAQFAPLFENAMLRDTIFICVAFFFCLLASYTLFSWIPVMLRELNFSQALASNGITTFHFGGMVGGVAVGWIIEGLGSRKSMLLLAGGSIITALLLAVALAVNAPSALTVLCLFVAEGFFIAGIHTVVYAMAAHAYPPVVKATGVGVAATIGRIGAITSSYTGEWTLSWGGSTMYFVSVAVLIAICMVAALTVGRQIGKLDNNRNKTTQGDQKTTSASQLESA